MCFWSIACVQVLENNWRYLRNKICGVVQCIASVLIFWFWQKYSGSVKDGNIWGSWIKGLWKPSLQFLQLFSASLKLFQVLNEEIIALANLR